MLQETGVKPHNADLTKLGIQSGHAYWNLPPDELKKMSIEHRLARETNTGAIAINTGKFTGRSPEDRFIVKDDITRDSVWWGPINKPFDPGDFDKLADKLTNYLNGRTFYVRDAYACADPKYRTDIRFITELPWSNLFVYNMFLRCNDEELRQFDPEWVVINAPGFMADPEVDGTRQANFAIINFTRKMAIVGGTGYTGEIKKGIFSALNFILPHQKNTLSMHCSANVGKQGDTAVFFGLSGTGKTTLSADPDRLLIGDDEHGWSNENTVFNFEGGCYAKCIDLSEEKEPDIFRAIKSGALLENVTFKPDSNEVDYSDSTITENTRVSYPIYHINDIIEPSIGHNPKHIFFLTCDAYGVLPPIARLTPEQAAFHFISGYTAKVAGTEAGITEPKAVFSACFGAPFMPLHPTRYADMLSEKMQRAGVSVWLVNTGWTSGPYGIGSRMKLKYTRCMIKAALEGQLDQVEYKKHRIFGVAMPLSCPDVPDHVLLPRNTWENPEEYDQKANMLASAFLKNFEKFESYASETIMAGAPQPIEIVKS